MDKGSLEKIRQSVVEAGLVLAHSSMTIGTYGNISCRVDENHIAITPSGRDYEQLTSADIVVTDLEGDVQKIDSDDGNKSKDAGNNPGNNAIPLRPSSELPLHLEIYKNFPEARAIVHTHSVYASALAVAHKDLPPVIEDLTQITGGAVRCTDYTIAGTKELGVKAVEAMEGGRSAALLANHGAVCWGRNMKEALARRRFWKKPRRFTVLPILLVRHSR